MKLEIFNVSFQVAKKRMVVAVKVTPTAWLMLKTTTPPLRLMVTYALSRMN